MNRGKIILGVLAGLAAGAILGVLFAPANGSETRRKFANQGSDFAESLKRKFDEFIDGLTDNNVKDHQEKGGTEDNL